VLPIGGLKEKALAAQRAGITMIIAPQRNEPDLDDFPENLREGMDFVWVGQVEEVFTAALEPARDGTGSRTRALRNTGARPTEPVAAAE